MSHVIDRNSAEPLYVQLRRAVLADAKSRSLKQGDRLPSEIEFERGYGVSRAVVRQAIQSLVVDGLVTRIQGKGTFLVREADSRPGLSSVRSLTSFTRNMLAEGHIPSVQTLVSREAELPIPSDDDGRAWYVLRLLAADGRSIGVQETWLPRSVLGGREALLSAEALDGNSLYEVLASEPLSLHLVRGVETVGVRLAEAAHAELLGCAVGDPLLHAQRSAYLGDGRLAEYTRIFFHPDRYSYRIELGG